MSRFGVLTGRILGLVSSPGSPLWPFIGVVAQSFGRFTVNLLVARIAGPATLGMVATLNATAAFAVLFGPSSVGAASSRFIAENNNAVNGHREVSRHLRTAGVVAVIAAAAIALTYTTVRAGGGILLGCFCGAIAFTLGAYSVSRGTLFGYRQYKISAALDVLAVGVSLSAIGVLFLLWGGGVHLALAPAAGYAVYALMSLIAQKKPSRLRASSADDTAQAKGALRRGGINQFIFVNAIGTICSSGLAQVSIMVSVAFGGAVAAGQFSAAMLTAAPFTMVMSSIAQVLLPRYAYLRSAEPTGAVGTEAKNIVSLVISFGIVFVSLVGVGAEWIMDLLWGSEFSESAQLFLILTLAVCAYGTAVPCVTAIMTKGRRGPALATVGSALGLLAGLISMALSWILGNRDVISVALSYLLGVLVTAVFVIVGFMVSERVNLAFELVALFVVVFIVGPTFFWLQDAENPWTLAIFGTVICSGALVWAYWGLKTKFSVL